MRITWEEPIRRKMEEFGWDVAILADRLGEKPARTEQIILMKYPQLPLVIKMGRILQVSFDIFQMARVFTFMAEKGMTTGDLASKMGIGKNNARRILERIERGPKVVRFQTMLDVAVALDKRVEDIIG